MVTVLSVNRWQTENRSLILVPNFMLLSLFSVTNFLISYICLIDISHARTHAAQSCPQPCTLPCATGVYTVFLTVFAPPPFEIGAMSKSTCKPGVYTVFAIGVAGSRDGSRAGFPLSSRGGFPLGSRAQPKSNVCWMIRRTPKLYFIILFSIFRTR